MKAMVLPRGRKWWSSISLERSFPDDSAWIRWIWLLDLGFCFFAYTNKNSGNDRKKWEKMHVWVRGQTCGRSDEEGCWAESNFANLNCGLNFFGIICQHLDCKSEWQARVKTDAHCPVSMCPKSFMLLLISEMWGEKENINIDHKEIYENINKEDF